jgi:hypothetical protein
MQNSENYQQYVITFMIAYIAALLPSEKSNIPPLLSSLILGVFLSKLFYGDFDEGYAWSTSDMYFVLIMSLISLCAGIISLSVSKMSENIKID